MLVGFCTAAVDLVHLNFVARRRRAAVASAGAFTSPRKSNYPCVIISQRLQAAVRTHTDEAAPQML